MADVLTAWALPQLRRLLPLDEQSLKEIITYSASLSKEAGAEHLKNLLGESPLALEFISSFNWRLNITDERAVQPSTSAQSSRTVSGESGVPGPRKKQSKKPKPPLHNAGPVRRPDNYGQVTGGYTKSSMEEDYIPKSGRPTSMILPNAPSLPTDPAALEPRSQAHHLNPSGPRSRERSPAAQSKLPPSAAGLLISDLPNVKSKTGKKPAHSSGSSTPHNKSTTTSSITDLTSAIATLELSTNPAISSERRRCDCNASIHPLFEPAPNCLSCGKIICALEGLQPCSFCDGLIVPKDQVQTMIRALKDERGRERMAVHNTAASHSGGGTARLGSGRGTPESSGDEGSSAAAAARAHRDKLLGFQSEKAQRTRVHDEAADYDLTVTPGATQWMGPMQKAAALKKQQKYLRELEDANKPEWEQQKTVMSMSIQNGKLIRTYERSKKEVMTDAKDEIHLAEQDEGEGSGSKQASGGGLGQNPLLAGGGLIRPLWRIAEDEKGKARGTAGEATERRQTWRRVQDDNDDNEQWILDGGIHGFADGGNWSGG